MRIESIAGTAGSVTSQSQPQASAAAEANTSAIGSATTTTAIDPATGQPKPLHYPWITRLSLELESKSAQKSSPFESVKPTGETLDKLV